MVVGGFRRQPVWGASIPPKGGGLPGPFYPFPITLSDLELPSLDAISRNFRFFLFGNTATLFWRNKGVHITSYFVLSAVTHAPFHASMLRPASQVGPMHEAAGMGEVS